jgi:hypothetical protein
MSFYTALSFYRPERPPKLTGADLASIISSFAALDLAAARGTTSYQIKFGRSIDQDRRSASWDEPVPGTGGVIARCESIEYDAEAWNVPSLSDLAQELSAFRDTIYRASLLLGPLTDQIYTALKRDPSEDNDQSLELDSWSMELGPIAAYELGGNPPVMVGWIEVALSGYGYLYPWSFRDLFDRAQALDPIHDLMALCRRTWPVAPQRPSRALVKTRQAMGDLWPYSRADLPLDWCWGLRETG